MVQPVNRTVTYVVRIVQPLDCTDQMLDYKTCRQITGLTHY